MKKYEGNYFQPEQTSEISDKPSVSNIKI